MSETTISSERIYEGRVINLRRDMVRVENGLEFQRDIVEHNGAVVIVPLLDNETVLLVSQYRYAAGKTLLEVPAGSINPGENPLECARRELVEETQHEAAKIERLFAMYSAPGFSTELLTVFLATNLTPKAGSGDDDEFIDVREVRLADALAMIDRGEIEDAKTIASLLAVARRLDAERA
jgi:ADP-ribose pyrophosphatase